MKNKRFDRDMPIGKLQEVNDFLPPPDKLVLPERAIKVTLRLNASSVKFFKEQARMYHTKYQKMLRFLVDKYVERYSA